MNTARKSPTPTRIVASFLTALILFATGQVAFSQVMSKAKTASAKLTEHHIKAQETTAELRDGNVTGKIKQAEKAKQIGVHLKKAAEHHAVLEKATPEAATEHTAIKKHHAEAMEHHAALTKELAKSTPDQTKVKEHATKIHEAVVNAHDAHKRIKVD